MESSLGATIDIIDFFQQSRARFLPVLFSTRRGCSSWPESPGLTPPIRTIQRVQDGRDPSSAVEIPGNLNGHSRPRQPIGGGIFRLVSMATQTVPVLRRLMPEITEAGLDTRRGFWPGLRQSARSGLRVEATARGQGDGGYQRMRPPTTLDRPATWKRPSRYPATWKSPSRRPEARTRPSGRRPTIRHGTGPTNRG